MAAPGTRTAGASGRLIGYARLSTDEQGTDPQLDELRAAGRTAILEEHASGADRGRPVLAGLLRDIRTGETLVMVRLVLRRKNKESLDGLLDEAVGTPLQEFAASLRCDLAAVQAALDLPWTTSSAESQINRLKMLKRTMFGRAGFRLLRARVLHAA